MGINDDIDFYYSGGSSGVAIDSLGGAISANQPTTSQDENLFLNLNNADAASGNDHFRCLYLKNNGIVGYDVEIYISTPTPSIDTSVYIGVGTSGIDGTEQTIGDEDTEPTEIIWQQRYFDYNATEVASIGANKHKAIWFKRVNVADSSGHAKDYFRVTLTGALTEAGAEVFSTDFSVDFQ